MSNIQITAEMNRSQVARCIPGAFYDRETRAWVLNEQSITPRAATVALKLFPELAVTAPTLVEERDKLIQDVRPFDNATPFDTPIEAPKLRARLAQEGKSLFRYQEIDLGYLGAVLDQHGSAYLGWSRGMGKTIGALSLIEDTESKRVMIVAPNTAKEPVWLTACLDYMSDDFDHIQVLPNTKAKRERVLKWCKDWYNRDESCILITNYEQLRLIGMTGQEWLKYGAWDIVIADEAHRIKNPTSKMARAIKKIPTQKKLALSGSIIMNHAEELFSQVQWLYPDRYRSKWRDWNDRFLDFIEGGFSRICVGIKIEKLDEMRRELGVFMVYRTKADEIDLPEKIEQTLEVELAPKQKKAYEELRDTCITRLDDGTTIAADEGMTMIAKLRQLATGLSVLGDEVTDSSKMDLALELIEDSPDDAFVVFTWYRAAAQAMYERLQSKGIESFVVDGSVKQDDRGDMITRFQNGEGRVFVGTISTMGESVNLQRANQAIFLDLSWNPGDNAQAADRVYRIGQEKGVTITRIVAKDTVDTLRVVPSVANKEALRSMILGGKE